MLMRKFAFILILFAIVVLCACNPIAARLHMLNNSNEHELADKRMAGIIDAIEQHDGDALKAMFSRKASDEAANIDDEIDYLFSLIQGRIESWERDRISSGESIAYGKTTKHIEVWYDITTDIGLYKIFFLDYTFDTINPDNAGLFALRAIKAESEKEQFTFAEDMAIAGVWQPPAETA